MKDFFDTSETDTILQFIRDELDDVPDDHIEVDTPLFRSRLLDSMNLLSLITFLEARFAIAISSADVVFENLDSVQHIVAFVARKRAIIPSA
jgi:acyl carrier protein